MKSLESHHPTMSLWVLRQWANCVLSSLLGTDDTSLNFSIFFKWAAKVKITELDIKMIQRILKITELEATAMRMQFLALFTNEFRSTVWTTRCNHMGT